MQPIPLPFRLLFLGLLPLALFAQRPREVRADSVWAGRDTVALGSAEVKAFRHSSPLRADDGGALRWRLEDLSLMPQILGNADPLHYARFLPGVQTNNEYAAGMHIHGSESSHNRMDIAGTPLYNVNHLLGFFSTFHPDHFEAFSLRKEPARAADPNRLGGTLSMQPHAAAGDSLSGRLTVGLMSSQGNLRLPLGPRMGLLLSARLCYMNLLYGSYLRGEHSQMRYDFNDFNATFYFNPHPRHRLDLELYAGTDRGELDHSSALARVHWGNVLGQARWRWQLGRAELEQCLSLTHCFNRFRIVMDAMDSRLPSSVTDWTYRACLRLSRWQLGAEVTHHRLRPQTLLLNDDYHAAAPAVAVQRATEAVAYAGRTQPLGDRWQLDLGLRAALFRQSPSTFAALDPSAALRWRTPAAEVALSYALRHQFLHQTGFTNMGLPTEYWLAASAQQPPQYAHLAALSASTFLARRRYRLSGEIFWKRLYHQLEYSGSLYDFMSQRYEPSKSLLEGRGTNYGFSAMLQKCSGRLTGWLGYTYTRARRRFARYAAGQTFPASHERPHEWNALATWKHNGRWDFGLTFTAASGTPFTAPRSVSLIAGNLVVDYGPHNANRLPAYVRLDLSANYHWTSRRGLRQTLNFSLYNATNRSNALFYALDTHKSGNFLYRPVSFLVGILPSVSYALTF